MNLPTDIPALEAELRKLCIMYDEGERRLAQSPTQEIDRIFFASTKQLRHELERRLQCAKAAQQRNAY